MEGDTKIESNVLIPKINKNVLIRKTFASSLLGLSTPQKTVFPSYTTLLQQPPETPSLLLLNTNKK